MFTSAVVAPVKVGGGVREDRCGAVLSHCCCRTRPGEGKRKEKGSRAVVKKEPAVQRWDEVGCMSQQQSVASQKNLGNDVRLRRGPGRGAAAVLAGLIRPDEHHRADSRAPTTGRATPTLPRRAAPRNSITPVVTSWRALEGRLSHPALFRPRRPVRCHHHAFNRPFVALVAPALYRGRELLVSLPSLRMSL